MESVLEIPCFKIHCVVTATNMVDINGSGVLYQVPAHSYSGIRSIERNLRRNKLPFNSAFKPFPDQNLGNLQENFIQKLDGISVLKLL